jgi:DNA replication protein DnaC
MNYNKLLNFVHQRMNYIRSLLDKSVTCLDVLAEFRDHSQELTSITTACLDKLNTDPLLKAIRAYTVFTQEPSFLTNKGQIVKLYYLLEQAERAQIFAPFIKLMSWVDCWLGVTDLVAEQGFCEARWNITSETPSLDLVDCWSPVGGKIANSIKLITLAPDILLDDQTESKSSLLDKEETKSSSDIITQNPEPLLDEQTDSTFIQEDKEDINSGLLDKEEDKSSSNITINNPEPLLDDKPIDNPKSSQEDKDNPESIQLDKEEDKSSSNPGRPNCLLTGPNGSGKSTFLKAIMSAVILGQTIGFTPAKEFRITPFRHLSTYLNIPDCQGRESLFQAEMRRCHDHLELLKSLEQSKGFSLNIMDEIFVSTNYMEGLSGAYGVIKSLEGYPHSLNIITTHFDKLTECQLPTFCYKYFTLDTKTMENGEIEIKKDYKLRDGINDKHMALHLLKLRGFDAELVKNAGEMYSSIAKPALKDS